MITVSSPLPNSARLSALGWPIITALFALPVLAVTARAEEGPAPTSQPLRIAVYDAPPYGSVEPNGLVGGLSVDLWRRAAEVIGRQYRFVPVSQMEVILEGLEHNAFDAAIGAITITPERVARVDFSYPAHRSGVAVAVKKDGSAMVAIRRYGAIVADLSPLVAFTLALLVAIGVTMWFVERPKHTGAHDIRCRYAA